MTLLAGREDLVLGAYSSGASVRKIAMQLGVSQQIVGRMLRDKGIEIRRQQPIGNPVPAVDAPVDPRVDALTKSELAYIAGLIDGEGCLLIYRKADKRGSRHFRCILRISNTSLRVVEWLQSRLGGKPAEPRPFRDGALPVYHWPCEGQRMASLLNAVYPYLVIKPELAQILLEMQRQLTYGGTGVRLPVEAAEAREALFARYQTERKEMRGR
jgi:hypothetical protein